MEEKSSLGWNLKLNVECAGIAIDIAGGVAAVVATCLFARSTLNGFRLWNCFLVDYTHKKGGGDGMSWAQNVESIGLWVLFGYQWFSTPASYFTEKFVSVREWINRQESVSVVNIYESQWKTDYSAWNESMIQMLNFFFYSKYIEKFFDEEWKKCDEVIARTNCSWSSEKWNKQNLEWNEMKIEGSGNATQQKMWKWNINNS